MAFDWRVLQGVGHEMLDDAPCEVKIAVAGRVAVRVDRDTAIRLANLSGRHN